MKDDDSSDFPADNIPDRMPDNINDWPKDTRIWFGLNEESTLKDLRKSYSRLIKRFRPELYPDQFERIQQEYEKLQNRFQENESFDPELDDGDSDDQGSILEQLKKLIGNMNLDSDISEEEQERQNAIDQLLDSVFLKIKISNWEGARKQLKEAMEDSYYGEIPALYLFWMEYVYPESSPGSLPGNLSQTMSDYFPAEKRSSIAVEKARNEGSGEDSNEGNEADDLKEVDAPKNAEDEDNLEDLEAVSELLHEIFMVNYLLMGAKRRKSTDESLPVSLKMLATWLQQQRFPASYPLYNFIIDNISSHELSFILNIKWNRRSEEDDSLIEIIHRDLDQLRPRVSSQSPKDWLSILIESLEHALWSTDSEAKEYIRTLYEEINQYSEFHDSAEKDLDNLDRLETVVQSWQSIPEVIPLDKEMLRSVLYGGWNMPFSIFRRSLLFFLAPLACDVIKLLWVFDYLSTYHSVVLEQLRLPLLQLFRSRHPELTQVCMDKYKGYTEYLRSIWETNAHDYPRCRLEYLAFFLREQIFLHPYYDYLILEIGRLNAEKDNEDDENENEDGNGNDDEGESNSGNSDEQFDSSHSENQTGRTKGGQTDKEETARQFKEFADKLLRDLSVTLVYYAIAGSDTN